MTVKRARIITLGVVLLTASIGAGQEFMWEPPGAGDYPAADAMIRSDEMMALRERVAEDALRKEPDRARTFDLLYKSGRTADAVAVLERIVRSRPADMRAAFEVLAGNGRELAADKAHDYAQRVGAAGAAAKRQLPAMPREDAARLARVLTSLDVELALDFDGWRQRLRAFVSEYAGTREALLVEVDLLTENVGPAMLDRLDAFAARHPGSEAAAKAVYMKGFHLSHNAFAFGWKPGQDPTDRFFQVMAIYRDLRSGRYPPNEWTDKAASLVAEFSAYKAVYAPANVDRMLAGYEEVLPVLLEMYEGDPARDTLGYVVGSRMGELYDLKGTALAGVDATFDRLERAARDANTVRLLRAEFYLRPPERLEAPTRDALRARAAPLLEALARDASGRVQRRALATLATEHFKASRLAEARELYLKFAAAYPESHYAWVAALRAAECTEPSDPKAAAAAFRAAAARFASHPLAAPLGYAYAARASEAADEYVQAVRDYRQALASWRVRLHSRFSLYSRRQPIAGESFMTRDLSEVRRDVLVERIATLDRTLRAAGGPLLEKGRRSFAEQRWDAAVDAVSQLLATDAASPLADEARLLASRARLEKALDAAAADAAAPTVAASIEQLEALTREPMNSATAAAKIALGTLGHLATTRQENEATITAALRDWQALDRARPPVNRGPLEQDVIQIRNQIFQPHGGGVFAAGGRWNGFQWSSVTAPYFLVNPALRVKSHTGEISTLVIYDPLPLHDTVVFLDAERRAMLERIMLKLGGTKKHAWVKVMDTPNQPAGASTHVMALWKNVFWVQPGHWGGWVFETYPIIHEIEFVDAARTRAAVKVTVGYAGATVQMEKKDGRWIARELTNFWVT